MMEKQHLIYKITNLLNGRFYVGMHTGYPDDGYFGSGKRLKAEIKKYGKENFKKEILEFLPTRKDLELREAEIVNERLLTDPLCLNLKNGGEGGGKKWSDEHQRKFSSAGGKASIMKNRQLCNTKTSRQKAEQTAKDRGTKFTRGMQGKTHNKLARMKISEANSGSGNSQFGTCWVTNGKPIKIKKEQLDEYLSNGYSRGRK